MKKDHFHLLRNKAHEIIREKGYVAAVELASLLVAYWYESEERTRKHAHAMNPVDIAEVIASIDESESFHRVEYANRDTEEFRRKDLFYYNPDGPIDA